MKKYAALVITAMLLVLGTLSPSYAGTDDGSYGSLSVSNASSIEDSCVDVEINFDTFEYQDSWEFWGEVTSPTGYPISDVDVTYSGDTNYVELCGYYDEAGTYTVAGSLTIVDGTGAGSDIHEDYSTTFAYTIRRKANASIGVTAKRSHAARCPGKANSHCWLVYATVKCAGKVWSGRRITLEGYDVYGWNDIRSCATDSRGQCGWYFQVKKGIGRFPLRFYSDETSSTNGATSRQFRMKY